MGLVEDRLGVLGHVVPGVTSPLASYVPAIRTGNLIFTSGQLPIRDGTLLGTGLVGVEVPVDQGVLMAQCCALNALAAIKSLIGDLDRVSQIVKVVGYVASGNGFVNQPIVINGASDLLGAAFGKSGIHARSAVGVSALPMGAPVELELIVEIRPDR